MSQGWVTLVFKHKDVSLSLSLIVDIRASLTRANWIFLHDCIMQWLWVETLEGVGGLGDCCGLYLSVSDPLHF
jgi:hypothetical protein